MTAHFKRLVALRNLGFLLASLMVIAVLPGRSVGQDLADAEAVTDTTQLPTRAVNLPARVTDEVNLRSAPQVSEETFLRTLEPNDALFAYESLRDGEGDLWYRVGQDEWVHGAEIRLPQTPPETFSGRWIDVDLNDPAMLTAYQDDEPVFSALAIKGRDTMETPEGTFEILRRVEDETMDSNTIGIPRSSPNGYYLQHVLYTQYFTDDGASIHDNYWSSNFGETGSHGCVGLNEADAAWVWNWADIGTVVNIHQENAAALNPGG